MLPKELLTSTAVRIQVKEASSEWDRMQKQWQNVFENVDLRSFYIDLTSVSQ